MLPEEEIVVVVNFYLFSEEFVWGVFLPHNEVEVFFEEAFLALEEGPGLIERSPFRDHEFEKTRLINSYRNVLRSPAPTDGAVNAVALYLKFDRFGVVPHRVFL